MLAELNMRKGRAVAALRRSTSALAWGGTTARLRMIVFGADSRTVNAPGYAEPYAYMGRGAWRFRV